MVTLLRGITTAVICFSLFSRPDPDVARGNQLYQEGKYSEALEAYKKVKPKDAKERRRLAFNRGTALLKLGELEEARSALQEAQGDEDANLRSRAAFNEGNAAFGMKDLTGAVRAFRKSLLHDPSYEPARRNLELSLLAMEKPDAGTPDTGPQDGSGDGGNNDGGEQGDGSQPGDGGQQGGDGGGGGSDGGSGQEGGQQQQQQQPQQQQQQDEITKQDALKLLDSMRDSEQDQLLMRFLDQEAQTQKPEKNW